MSIVLTAMQNLRDNAAGYYSKETLASRYGALNFYMQDARNPMGTVSPALIEKARRSNGRTLQTAVLNDSGPIAMVAVRNATIADQQATSAMVNFTFVTYAFEFTIVPVAHDNNEVSMQQEFNQLMNERIIGLGKTLDSACITNLDAAKTQVLADDLGTKYTFAADTVVSADAQKDDIIGDINALMEGNDYYRPIHVVGNPALSSHLRTRLYEQGEFNDRNKSYQYQDKSFHWSNRVANPVGSAFTCYAIEEGSCGILFRPERESLHKTMSRTGHQWDEMLLPGLEVPVGTYYYESVGDWNAYNGATTADMTRARKLHYGMAIDVALFTTYNSAIATKQNPILKINSTIA